MPRFPGVSAKTTDSVPLDDVAKEVDFLRSLDKQISRLTERRSRIRERIKDKLGDAESGTVNGRPVVTWARTLRVALSHSALKERYPEIAQECSGITEVRTFRLVSP